MFGPSDPPHPTLYHTLCTQTDHITIKCVARRKLLRLCLHCVLLPLALIGCGFRAAVLQSLIEVEFVSSYVFVQIVD